MQMHYITKSLDTDILVLNHLRDYQLVNVLLINKTIYSILNCPKFWKLRILTHLGLDVKVNSNKGQVWKMEYLRLQKVLLKNVKYKNYGYTSLESMKLAVRIDKILSQENLESLLETELGILFFRSLPDEIYTNLKSRVLENNIRVDLLDEYVRLGNRKKAKILLDNILFGCLSFKNARIGRGSQRFFVDIQLPIIKKLLSLGIFPSRDRVKDFLKNKYAKAWAHLFAF